MKLSPNLNIIELYNFNGRFQLISGEVGDWKNHFTVAENEQFEKLLEENFKGTNIEFVYSI